MGASLRKCEDIQKNCPRSKRHDDSCFDSCQHDDSVGDDDISQSDLSSRCRSRHVPLAGEPANVPLAREPRVAVFDFDNTLSTQMVYNDLGGSTAHSLNMLLQNARQRLALDPRFWVKEFGGIERVQALEQMLSSLKSAGVLLYICSFNDDSVILEALYHLGLLQFFAGVNGNPNILSSKLGDKGMRVRQAIQAVAARPERTMFIDDSERNCIQVTNVNPGVCPYNCKETGLNTRDMMQIVEWFKASGEGN